MALRLVNKNIEFPPLYPKVERTLATATSPSFIKVGDHVLRKDKDFIPQPGLQEEVCSSDCNLIFMCGQATSGKAQPYDAKVLTPKGFVEMGSLQVGDTIMGADGKPQKVLQIFEQGEKDVYRLTFDDGAETECCKEHLWQVLVKNKKSTRYNKSAVIDTENIISLLHNNAKIAIPYCKPIESFTTQELPIKPYTLGALLGDGGLTDKWNQMFTTIDIGIVNRIKEDGYDVSQYKSNSKRFLIKGEGLREKINQLGLRGKHSWEKHIPSIYKFASLEDRLAIIQGLFDTDGTVYENGSRVGYCTTSKQLALDVQWICRSLGCRCAIKTSIHKFSYKGEEKIGRLQYRLNITATEHTPLFNLDRKRERHLKKLNDNSLKIYHKISNYKLIGKKQCRCILVSNADHLYITDDFIVTHNTFAMYLKALQGIEKYGFTARLISVRALDSKKGSSIFRDGVTVLGNYANCQYSSSDVPTFAYPQWNSNLQLIHSNFNVESPKEWEEFQDYAKKVQASLIMIDEATEMKHFKMFSFWWMRNRDASGMTPQMILSFNPLHTHWTTQILTDAGYLDENGYYLRPEMIGKIRYFYVKGDNPEDIVWGNTREEVVAIAKPKVSQEDREAGLSEIDMIKSFTVFTGTASGNRELVNATKGQSVANLHAVGATQRAVVGEAYFGPIENEELNVTHSMINNLWNNPYDPKEPMYATMDISSGSKGNDKCPMVIWQGLRIIAILFFQGEPHEIAPWIQKQLHTYKVPIENFAYDATGHGYWMKGLTNGTPVTSNARPKQEVDEYGNMVQAEQYFNLRSQLLGKMKVMFERGDISCAISKQLAIPYGRKGELRNFIDILYDEINVFISTTQNKKIYYRNKDEYKSKFKHSPDIMDAITLRAVFELDAREKKKPSPRVKYNAYDGLYKRPNINPYQRQNQRLYATYHV